MDAEEQSLDNTLAQIPGPNMIDAHRECYARSLCLIGDHVRDAIGCSSKRNQYVNLIRRVLFSASRPSENPRMDFPEGVDLDGKQ